VSTPAPGGCTPDGTVPVSARQLEFPAGDAAVQAAAGEATVIGTNQDLSTIGAADAASGLATQKSNIAMTPATTPQFTRDE